jgi:hypothetical protein
MYEGYMDLKVGLVAVQKGNKFRTLVIRATIRLPSRNVVTIPTPLSWLLYVMLLAFINNLLAPEFGI